MPATFGSVGLLLQPALATIIAWFLFAESPSLLQLLGVLIVIVGIYFTRRGTR
ncbi:MAG TPA: EamA family transporter [Rhodospirillales bacterium]|nr:EamA family transporter [Rhodospirillales bacterium]HJO86498.1 EamA family transporter [Rhodospirillales bacterium]